MYAEALKKPKGNIQLLSHRGEGRFKAWKEIDPALKDLAEKDPFLKKCLEDARFGVFDLSNVEMLDKFEDHNLIVNQASVLMAQRMAPGDVGTAGIGYLAVGTGYGTGTQSAPQAEDPTYTALRSEAFRKAITSWTYLDANGNAVGTPPTGVGVLQITTTFAASEANFALVEMGLFGGNATTAANSGQMFNYKVFPVWNKTAALNASLTIVWTLTF